MKYVCFGYLNLERWSTWSEKEQLAAVDRCLAYDESVLKKENHWVYGEGLQGPEATVTLNSQNGKVVVTDGPYMESKELLGGLLVIEARDLNHAIQLISNHPGIHMGRWEIRPAEDMTQMIAESEKRRGKTK